MNGVSNWWLYQIVMTLYVISMPMLAAVWTCYAIVYIWCDITVEDQQKKTIEAGMTYHLSKPIDPSLLYHVLSTYLVQIHRTKFLHQKCSFVFPSTNIPID